MAGLTRRSPARPISVVVLCRVLLLVAMATVALLSLDGAHGGRNVVGVPVASSGTAVCGALPPGVTTWTAAGAPYAICSSGAGVPSGSTLVVDGTAGTVHVKALGQAGLVVDGGTLRTSGTTAVERAVFDGPSTNAGSWDGVAVTYGGTVDVAHVDVAHARTGLSTDAAAEVRVVDASITNASVDGIAVTSDGPVPVVTDSRVSGVGRYGVAVHGPAGGTIGAVLQRLQLTDDGLPQAGSLRSPAVLLDGVGAAFGPGKDVDALVGTQNGIDAISWTGRETADLTWPSATFSLAVHPLGIVPVDLHVDGRVTLPAGAVVKGQGLSAAGLDGSAGGAALLGVGDSSAGESMCPSTILTPCQAPGGPVRVTSSAPGRLLTLSSASVRSTDIAVSGPYNASSASITGSTVRDSSVTVDGASLLAASSTLSATSDVTSNAVLTVQGCTFDRSTVHSSYNGIESATITGSRFSNAGGSAVDISGGHGTSGSSLDAIHYATQVVLHDDVFTGNGVVAGDPAPAVILDAVDIALGRATNVTGSGNGIDAIVLSGRDEGSFTWQSPVQSATTHPLGYLIDGAGLLVGRPAVVTIPARAVVKGNLLSLEGADLDASAGGAVFTGLWDNSVGPITCPSTVLATCTHSLAETDVDLAPAYDGTRQVGTATIIGATLHSVVLGRGWSEAGAPEPIGGSLVVRSTTGDHVAVVMRSGSLTMTDDVLSDAGVRVADASLQMLRSRVSCLLGDTSCGAPGHVLFGPAVDVHAATDQVTVELADDHVSGGLVWVESSVLQLRLTHVSLRRVDVSGTDARAPGVAVPAVWLQGVQVRLGPGGDVDAVTGSGNQVDGIQVDGEVVGGFAWPPLVNSPVTHPLGLIPSSGPRGLTVVGPGTVTVPAGTVIKGYLTLQGASLDASAGGLVMTTHDDNSVGVPLCRQQHQTDGSFVGCDPSRAETGSLTVSPAADGGPTGTVVVRDGQAQWTSIQVTAGDSATHLRWEGGSIRSSGVGLDGAALTLRHVSLTGTSLQLVNSTGTLLDHVSFTRSRSASVHAANASATVTGSRFTSAADADGVNPTLLADGTGHVELSCDEVTGNPNGVQLSSGSVVSDSDLYGNTRAAGGYDLGGHPDVPTTATHVWWGQPGGPVAGQVGPDVTLVDSADAPNGPAQAPAGAVTLSGPAVRPDGTVGTGELVVSVSFSHRMDVTAPLPVTLVGRDGVAHPLVGTWQGPTSWSGSYVVSSATADPGAGQVRVAAADGCSPSASDVSAPLTKDVVVDVPLVPVPVPPVPVPVPPVPAPVPLTPIQQRYVAMGGPSSFLRAPVGAEVAVPGGREQQYERGDLLWSAAAGVREVHGLIDARYRAVAGPRSVLGMPTTDETVLADRIGRCNQFQHGSIYWSPASGAHAVVGAIRARWAALGWERSRLGYPTSDETAVPGGRQSTFEHGVIHWAAATGVVTVAYR